MKPLIARFACLLVALLAAGVLRADDVVDARAALAPWLKLLDSGKLEEAYAALAAPSRELGTVEKWKAGMEANRASVGAVLTRAEKKATAADKSPRGRPGRFVVFEQAAKTDRKLALTETITVMFDEPGAWRVAGYVLQK